MACNLYIGVSAAAAVLLMILATVPPSAAARKLSAMQSSKMSVAQVLGTMKSPLSDSAATNYAQLYKQTGTVGDLCRSGHLYCDVQAYDAYYRKVLQPAAQAQAGKNIVVFFRASELLVGRQTTIVDPRLQSIAIERNRQALNADTRISPNAYYFPIVFKVPGRAFLPAKVAKVLPIATLSAAQIFNLDESSALAQESSKSIQVCKGAMHKDGTTPLEGETAACVTSLEEFQSLLRSPMLLGPHDASNVEALVTDTNLQSDFTGQVVAVTLKAGSESRRHAVCHNLMYPSAVYFCHYLPHTRVYAVTLRQETSKQLLEVVALCHMETSGWNPGHLAFQNLNAVPGKGEACHWVFQGSFTFVPV